MLIDNLEQVTLTTQMERKGVGHVTPFPSIEYETIWVSVLFIIYDSSDRLRWSELRKEETGMCVTQTMSSSMC